jgi:hypothetical protein
MARHSTAVCDTLVLSRSGRLSGRLERMRFRSVGSDRCVPSASTTCLSSTKLACVEQWRHMSATLIIGVRIDRFANARHAIRQGSGLEPPTGRSPQRTSSADCITSTGAQHEGPHFCDLHLLRSSSSRSTRDALTTERTSSAMAADQAHHPPLRQLLQISCQDIFCLRICQAQSNGFRTWSMTCC